MTMPLPLIRPVSDLRTDLGGICDMARETQQPIFMTKNGKASLVVFDSEAYERQRQHDRFVEKLREAEIEAKYRPDTVSQAELDGRVSELFRTWEL